MRRLGFLVVALVLSLSPLTSAAADHGEPAFATKVADVALVRPVSMVGSIITSAVAVGLSPITWMTGTGDGSIDYLIAAPWRFTAHRDPGVFARYRDGHSATGRLIRR